MSFLYAGQTQSIGKIKFNAHGTSNSYLREVHPVTMTCFQLKDKWHLQRRNKHLTETAAHCELEPTSGTGGTPGECHPIYL